MSNNTVSDIADHVAHVPHVLVQVYLGTFLFLLISPLIVFVSATGEWESPEQGYRLLLVAFPQFWTEVLGAVTPSTALLMLFIFYPIGFLFSECGYRLARFVRYHGALDPDDEKYSAKHFELRCAILKDPIHRRLWDWQLFQFDFFYYSELLLAVFSVGFLVALIMPALYSPPFEFGRCFANGPFVGGTSLLALSVLTFFLVQTARKRKLEDFKNAHEACRRLLEPAQSSTTV